VGFFGEQEIPDLSITRITRAQISHLFEQYRDPSISPDFD